MENDMYMSMSLGSEGPSTIPNKARVLRKNHESSMSEDVKIIKKGKNRPDFYSTDDIPGTKPRPVHLARNLDYLTEIEGSRPRRRLFATKRCVDPNTPDYKLPSCQPLPIEPPRFLRDAHNVKDIEGTSAKPMYKFAIRESYDCKDIEGARAGWKPRHQRARLEGSPQNFDVKDINDPGFTSTRCTNPLVPHYFINGMQVSDDIKYTTPKKLPQPTKERPFFPLYTSDIPGAQSGFTPSHALQPPLEQRRHFRNTNFVGDIPGAKTDTLQYAMRTNRHTNPLNPKYSSLDGPPLDDALHRDYSCLSFTSSKKIPSSFVPPSSSTAAPAAKSTSRSQRAMEIEAVKALPP